MLKNPATNIFHWNKPKNRFCRRNIYKKRGQSYKSPYHTITTTDSMEHILKGSGPVHIVFFFCVGKSGKDHQNDYLPKKGAFRVQYLLLDCFSGIQEGKGDSCYTTQKNTEMSSHDHPRSVFSWQ